MKCPPHRWTVSGWDKLGHGHCDLCGAETSVDGFLREILDWWYVEKARRREED